MKALSMTAHSLSKAYNRKTILADISFELSSPGSLAITGKNGAGKTTLIKILSGTLAPTDGSIEYRMNGTTMRDDQIPSMVGFVSPYLNLYDEFSAVENMQMLSRVRLDHNSPDRLQEVLTMVNLWHRRNDNVGTFSSGMKQRLKFAFAWLAHPCVLFIDEPTTNLDEEGIQMVHRMVEEQRNTGILIIATNEKQEAAWCHKCISL